MTQFSNSDLLSLMVRLAGEAAQTIMDIRRTGFSTALKADRSVVTEADREAETLIVQELRCTVPDIPVIAEEEISAGKVMTGSDQYWLVDPLDGTREFAAGRDNFTVNIGLVRHGRPVLGVVALPAFDEIFVGEVGQGAIRIDRNHAPSPIHIRPAPPEGMTVMASHHYKDDPAIQNFLRSYRVAEVHNIGSAVKFIRVAQGVADFYPRFGPTMEWDTAAPQAIVEAAGGHVVLMNRPSDPLTYGKGGWQNPDFICYGAPPQPL